MDEIEAIARFNRVAPPDRDAVARARAALREVFEEDVSIQRVPTRRPIRRILGIAATVAAASLLVALVLPSLLGVDGSATAALLRMSHVASKQPEASLDLGEYVYTKTRALLPTCTVDGCTPQEVIRESWKGLDGSGRIIQDDNSGLDRRFGPGHLTSPDLSDVPTAVSDLREYIEERAAGNANGNLEMFIIVGDLLRETQASPELRAALFEVASTLPGVELVGETLDQIGRPGVGVAYPDDANRRVLIFDPHTSVVLGERTERPDGSVESWSVTVRSGIVDSVEERP